jgi:hypothetical protein
MKMNRPIDMLLFCPCCNLQHVDAPDESKKWTNPPHRSHECQHCGYTWRPADVPTNGVHAIKTKGKRDGTARPMIASYYREIQMRALKK